MAILNIDTSVLRSSVSVAEQANEAITEASGLLNAITVHEDWYCTERDRIKEMTLSNKQKAQQIRERSSAFYSAVKTASERFDMTEQDSCHRINGVDDIIGRISTVVPKISESVFGGSGSGSDINIVDMQNFGNAMEE
ncbi:MAG: hypothetical protein KH828_02965 [Clostridiales bacterium]|nr:hypothetical protein [Clostridiales bacterium]